MNYRATWTLFCSAVALLAVIVLVERPLRKASRESQVPRLLPKFQPSEVSRLGLRLRGQPETVLVRSNGQWFLTAPIQYPAEAARVEALLQDLAGLEWQTRLTALDLRDRTNVLDEFGFTSPMLALRIEAGQYERHLLLGTRTALGDQVSAQIVGGDGCYLIGVAVLNHFPADYNNWRDRRLLDWSAQPGDRIKVVSALGSFELESNSTNGLWSLIQPLPARADNQKVNSLVAGLGSLRVAKFVSDDPAADLDSFGSPAQNLNISFSTGTNYRSGLIVGGSPTNAPGFALVRRPNLPGIFLVAATNLEPWRVPLSDIRDRHVVKLGSNDVSLVEIDANDRFRVRREPGGRWTVTATNEFPADPELMDGLLSALNQFEVNFEMAVVTDYSAFGLTSPPVRLRLWRDPRARPEDLASEIDFGATKEGRVYVRRADETAVNSISIEEFRRIPRASWQLRDRHVWNFSGKEVASVTILQKGAKLRLVHGQNGDWSISPGFQGLIRNTDSLQEGVTRLGELQAVFWSGRGDDPSDRFGLVQTAHEITLDVRDGSRMREFTIQFGRASEFQNPYASVVLDGDRWFFEFPWVLYREFVEPDLSIHPVPAPSGR